MNRRYYAIATILCVLGIAAWGLVATKAQKTNAPIKYPAAVRGDVVDDYHGTKVADPYRWMEAPLDSSSDLAAWI